MTTQSVPPRWAVAIASSAGGITALEIVLAALPANLDASLLIVQHLGRKGGSSQLASILDRCTGFRVSEARSGDVLVRGNAYVAPPDRHMIVTAGLNIELTDDEPMHFVRPAADALFPTVAAHFRSHAIAVVLTGTGSDGALGAETIHQAGGIVIVQNEATSEHFSMPSAAIRLGHVHHVVPVQDVAQQIARSIASHDSG